MASFVEGLSRLVRSPGFKFFLVALLVLLLSIPLLFVYFLVEERSTRSSQVMAQIAEEWGGVQSLRGPYLIVPYTVRVVTGVGDKRVEEVQERRAVFLPDRLDIQGSTKSEVRKRSIYEATVYRAYLTLTGQFAAPDMTQIEPEIMSVRWRDAVIALGLSDVSGLKDTAALLINGTKNIPFEPSFGLPGATLTGIHARLSASSEAAAGQTTSAADASAGPAAFSFSISLSFNGSSDLYFAPVARQTTVSLSSDWRHPSFAGAFLPGEHTITPEGFSAKWSVPHLARSVPQAWSEWKLNPTYSTSDPFQSYLFGVKFYIPIDYYDLVTRAAKYGLMFLAVAFGAILVLELRSPMRVHAVQYIFVGLAMIFFYGLLLSMSEHIGFTGAYVLSALATGGMLSTYTAKALHSTAKGLVMLGVFLLLYGLLYLILRLEDYALLAGAIAGFVMLTIVMFVTLKVNWSGDEPQTSRQAM